MAANPVSSPQELLRPDALPDMGFDWSTPEELALHQSDEFRLYCCKVLPCIKAHPHEWKTCPFAHRNEAARRRDPRMYQYVDILCPDLKKKKRCPRADNCCYSHNLFEYWMHPRRYRTQLCNDGESCQRQLCFFAHTLQQLRPCPESDGTSAEVVGAQAASTGPSQPENTQDSKATIEISAATTVLSLSLRSANLPAGTTQSAPTSPPRGESVDGDHQHVTNVSNVSRISGKLQGVLPSGIPTSRRRNSDTATLLMSAAQGQDALLQRADMPADEALTEALRMLATLSSEARRPPNPPRQQRLATRNHRAATGMPSVYARHSVNTASYLQPPASAGLALAISSLPGVGRAHLGLPQQAVQYVVDGNGQLQLATFPVLVVTQPMAVCDSSLAPHLLSVRGDHQMLGQPHVQHMLQSQSQPIQPSVPHIPEPQVVTPVSGTALSWSGASSMQEFTLLYHQLQSKKF